MASDMSRLKRRSPHQVGMKEQARLSLHGHVFGEAAPRMQGSDRNTEPIAYTPGSGREPRITARLRLCKCYESLASLVFAVVRSSSRDALHAKLREARTPCSHFPAWPSVIRDEVLRELAADRLELPISSRAQMDGAAIAPGAALRAPAACCQFMTFHVGRLHQKNP